jgi:hypothetical protein
MGISLYSWKPMVWSWIENKMYIYVDLYADGSLSRVRTLCIYGDTYISSSYFCGFTTTHKIHDNWFTTNGYVHIF